RRRHDQNHQQRTGHGAEEDQAEEGEERQHEGTRRSSALAVRTSSPFRPRNATNSVSHTTANSTLVHTGACASPGTNDSAAGGATKTSATATAKETDARRWRPGTQPQAT